MLQYTPASQRILQAVALHLEDQPAPWPWVLLHQLLGDESRAQSLLQASGVSLADVLEAQSRRVDGDDLARPESAEAAILGAARRAAAAQGQGEVATEHLLWGLWSVPTETSDWLRAQAGRLAELLEEYSPEEPGTIPRDGDSFTLPQQTVTTVDRSDTYRLIDAAGNRAREGLRVIEDYVRFALNDAFLSGQLKSLRHDLVLAMEPLPAAGLLASRDTPGDVGTRLSVAHETHREHPSSVVIASFKRLQEALRSLEEYSKVISGAVAGKLEQLRYRSYTLEQAVVRRVEPPRALDAARLYLLVTDALCDHGLGPAVLGALAAGVKLVQLREKTLSDRALLEVARRLRRWTRDAEALLIINDRPDIALLSEADGVHVGQDELTVADARRIVGHNRLVGVSTHTIEQARQAMLDGADYLGVGPVFPSGTKTFEEFPGLRFVEEVAGEISLPWYAIGGIDSRNLERVVRAGAQRVAVSGAICRAVDPAGEARALLSWLPPTG